MDTLAQPVSEMPRRRLAHQTTREGAVRHPQHLMVTPAKATDHTHHWALALFLDAGHARAHQCTTRVAQRVRSPTAGNVALQNDIPYSRTMLWEGWEKRSHEKRITRKSEMDGRSLGKVWRFRKLRR